MRDNVTFTCDVCCYPEERSYVWSFNGTEVGSEESLSIPDVTEDDYGNYTCTVTNLVDGKQRSTVLVYYLQARGKSWE